MKPLELTLAIGDYDQTRDVAHGMVRPEAIALRWLNLALDDHRSWLGLPHCHVPERQVFVQGQPIQLAHVLHGLREAA